MLIQLLFATFFSLSQATEPLPLPVKAGPKGTVVVFLSAKCPCSNSHIGVLKNLASEFKDFAFVGVHSNVDESPEVSKEYFKNANLPFSVIQDPKAKIADAYKASKTPHAFLVAADGTVKYKGGVTDSKNGGAAESQYLREALTELQNGKEVSRPEGRTLGCAISRGEKFVW
jgi:peroxiredoxin